MSPVVPGQGEAAKLRTYCSCDHLTHFAVLMQLKDHEVKIFKR